MECKSRLSVKLLRFIDSVLHDDEKSNQKNGCFHAEMNCLLFGCWFFIISDNAVNDLQDGVPDNKCDNGLEYTKFQRKLEICVCADKCSKTDAGRHD